MDDVNILILDDEASVVEVIRDLVEFETDYHVIPSTDPRKALKLLDENEINVILTDFLMPGMNGIEFLIEAKKNEKSLVSTMIMLTGYADKENAIRAINEVGIYHYIEKPWDNDELLITINNAVERGDLITELRKEYQEIQRINIELQQSEERYRLFVQNFQGIAYQCDKQFKPILLHGTVDNLTGYNAKDFTSGIIEWGNILYPEDLSGYRDENKKLLSDMNFSCIREYRILHKNGEKRWVREIAHNICDESGNLKMVQGAVYDITDYVKAKKISDLRQQQLIQADKMASLGILVSGVAHEINNPNQYIMSNISILHNIWGKIEPILENYYKENGDFSIMNMSYHDLRENIEPLFSGILDGSDRIKTIVQELRDFARQGSDDMTEDVEINSVVKSAQILLSNMIKKSTGNFNVSLGEKIPLFKGNYRRLEQVVINLIQNACQAISDKEKSIMVITSYDKETGCVVLEVHDEGVGIHDNDIQNITDPFYTTKRDSGGTGLGLSISSAIINDQGGSLTFSSIPGKGTNAKVLLPVKGHI
ncbi:ATP-binding protein [Candidatus Latescibacterota bacterium]